jgi:hypothetical protein
MRPICCVTRDRARLNTELWMSNEQLYLAIGVPIFFNTVLVFLLMSRISDLKDTLNQRFQAVDQRFQQVDQRFQELKELWRAELRRVEEILDARLKPLAERP